MSRLDYDHMKTQLQKELTFIEEQKNFAVKHILDGQIDTIKQGRDLVRDVILISTTVVGFVIPLLLSSDVNLDSKGLLISAVIFIGVILYGIVLLLRVLRKELGTWPKTLEGVLKKLTEDQLAIKRVLVDVTLKNFHQDAYREIAERHRDDRKVESWFNKLLNHDVGFYGLFFLALTLFAVTILASIFKSG